MTKTIVIKKEKGQSITLNAEQIDHNIVLTKSGDKTKEALKRKIIIEAIDMDVYKEFVKIKLKRPRYHKIFEFLKNKL